MAGLELFVGGWFATPVIKSVLEKAQKYLGANYGFPKDTQGMVEELTNTLLLCQSTVPEAEKGAIINNNPAVGDWLRRLKETAYDAEDVLDNIEAQSIKEEVQGKNKVRKLASSSLSLVRNVVLSEDNHKSLKKIVAQLNQLSNNIKTILDLVDKNENNESHTLEVIDDKKETIYKPLEEVGLYGRRDELNMILDIILRSESESTKNEGKYYNNYHGLLVIPIVGISGVGKTALAKAVYNNPEVQQTFASQAWISVSNKLDIVSVMRKIIQSVKAYQFLDVITLENVSRNLSWIIERVKFLIVLDDCCGEIVYQWEYLFTTLCRSTPGSVILITTQDQVFADKVGTFGPIPLSALQWDIFWNLFKHVSFRNLVMPEEKRRTLESIGKEIAEKLCGLPLAAKIIGKILRTNIDQKSWGRIAKSVWWNMPEGKSRILPTIALGYEQLDPCLRQCFAYCSIFPRNSLIEKDRLIHMWIAQNFIQSDVGSEMKIEDVGREWFDELVERSFFQRAWDNNSYVMHELMHDLAVIVSSGECFYLEEGLAEIPLGVRHLAVDTNNLEVIKGIQKQKKLRSFLYFVCSQVEGMYSAINDMLSNLDCIRVLDLSFISMEKELKPPPSIWNLQHLRFLDLSSTGIKVLTHSCINHDLLQALYIRKCKLLDIPSCINGLINLRHLCADEETIVQISGIGQLTNLQQLGVFFVGEKEGHRITELRNLREIRGTLIVKNFENIINKDEAMQAKLVDKKYLDRISIYSSTTVRKSTVDCKILEGLQPHKDIKYLSIHSYVGSYFPNWIIQIGNFEHLNTVYLYSFVHVEVLPPLGVLPFLKDLQIQDFPSVKLIDYYLYGVNPKVFPLLEELVLNKLCICEEWKDARVREFFPLLSKLTISNNETLREAPLHLFSLSLKKLTIDGCNSLISLENSIPHLSCLTHLELCNSSTSVSFDPRDMLLLEDINFENCSELKIEGDLHSLIHLKRLKLVKCSNLLSKYSTKNQQKGKGLQVHQEGLPSLTNIEADHSLLHHEYHLILGSLPSLRVLNFKNSEFTRFTNHQNLWFQELTALQEIHFSNCEFGHLPASLTRLSSLKKMELISCTKLESLSDSMPPNLQELFIDNCSKNLVRLCNAYPWEPTIISLSILIHIDHYNNYKEKFPFYPITHKVRSMTIQKQQISDAIGQQTCAFCRKRFKRRHFVLRNWWP